MIDHLAKREAHDEIVAAIEHVLAGGLVRTPDLGGTATTREMTAAILAALPADGPG